MNKLPVTRSNYQQSQQCCQLEWYAFQTYRCGLSPFYVPLFLTRQHWLSFKHDYHMLLSCWSNCSDITWTIASLLWFSCSYSRQCSDLSTSVSSMSLFIVTPPFAVATRGQGAPGQMTWLKGFRPGCLFFLSNEINVYRREHIRNDTVSVNLPTAKICNQSQVSINVTHRKQQKLELWI